MLAVHNVEYCAMNGRKCFAFSCCCYSADLKDKSIEKSKDFFFNSFRIDFQTSTHSAKYLIYFDFYMRLVITHLSATAFDHNNNQVSWASSECSITLAIHWYRGPFHALNNITCKEKFNSISENETTRFQHSALTINHFRFHTKHSNKHTFVFVDVRVHKISLH